MDNKELIKKIKENYNYEAQIRQAIEEMSELTTALCHYLRGRRVRDHVQEEIADCYAVLDQMTDIFGADEIEKWKVKKQERMVRRLKARGVEI